jgi:hypothetical protein
MAGPAVCTLVPFTLVRRWNATPRSVLGVASSVAWREPAVRSSRIMIPALTHRSRFSTLATRTVMEKSPPIWRKA